MTDADRAGPQRPGSGTAELLRRYGHRPRKSLGQNFLADDRLCEKIAGLIGQNRSVLEIGAGMGALTAPLVRRCPSVVAVEADPAMVRILSDRFAEEVDTGRLRVLHADARNMDIGAELEKLPRPRALAGNLPYHLSGLLLRRAVDCSRSVDHAVFLLQLEVVDRLCAPAGTEPYGALSVFAQAVYRPRRELVVKRGAFVPQPKVDSAVVSLSPLDATLHVSDELAALVRAAFGRRRKTLRNAWAGVLGLSGPQLAAGAEIAGIDLGARGETLGVEQYRAMEKALRQLAEAAR